MRILLYCLLDLIQSLISLLDFLLRASHILLALFLEQALLGLELLSQYHSHLLSLGLEGPCQLLKRLIQRVQLHLVMLCHLLLSVGNL